MSRSAQAVKVDMARQSGKAAPPALSTSDFERFQRLIYREAGIHLPPSKRQLLQRRLVPRLKALQLADYGSYYRLVNDAGADAERVEMLNCVTTNETRFFRESRQFELLEQEIVPGWRHAAEDGRRPRTIRAWSAACSSGQEAYSIAMVLLQALPPSAGWKIEVLATDISTAALEVARDAVWPIEQLRDIPERYLKSYMLRGKGARAGSIKAMPELRSAVDCRRLNLHRDGFPSIGHFDLILCRNVLIYFDQESSAAVIERLLRHLAPDGYLFGGHAESLSSITPRVRAVVPTVYRHAEPRGTR